jgi:hypothetical protein
MTRSEIKRQARLLGQHYFSGDLDQDPFGLDILVNESANDVARLTDCLIGRRYLDIDSTTDEYCSSDLYRIKQIMVLNTDGNYKRLKLVEWYEGNNEFYRRDTLPSIPTHAIVFGGNRIKVYPGFAVDTPSGLMIEGYSIPGDTWQYTVGGSPSSVPVEDQQCPLPIVAHDCVVYGVLYKKAIQQRDMEMVPYYQGEFEKRLGMVESFAATYARRAT